MWVKFFRQLLNVILPPRCILCGKILSERNGLCSECFNTIRFVSEPLCARCGRPFSETTADLSRPQLCGTCLQQKRPIFALRRFAFVYDDASKPLILGFKFLDKTQNAEVLANMLWRAGKDIWSARPDLLVPVPIHYRRLLQRKYNQSALLAKYLARQTAVPVDYFSLKRTQNTVPQVQLSGKARRQNLRHAFTVAKPQNIKGRKIVLIDDVETTGSTLLECAKALKKAGAAEIYSLTLARTV